MRYKGSMPTQSIAELVRETRGDRSLADFAHVVGCSTASVFKWEEGAIPSTRWLVRLSEVTGRSLQDIIGLSLRAGLKAS